MCRSLLFAPAVVTLVLAPALQPASADPSAMHHVRYTVSSAALSSADIYYRDADPPTWAAYSHNPYVFSPRVEADIGPDESWVLNVMLADPTRWAMVTVDSAAASEQPMIRCRLEVDGVLVDSSEAPRGVLCSIREW